MAELQNLQPRKQSILAQVAGRIEGAAAANPDLHPCASAGSVLPLFEAERWPAVCAAGPRCTGEVMRMLSGQAYCGAEAC